MPLNVRLHLLQARRVQRADRLDLFGAVAVQLVRRGLRRDAALLEIFVIIILV